MLHAYLELIELPLQGADFELNYYTRGVAVGLNLTGLSARLTLKGQFNSAQFNALGIKKSVSNFALQGQLKNASCFILLLQQPQTVFPHQH